MAFTVRIFAYSGMIQVQQRMVKQYNADSVFMLDEPYIWRQPLLTNGLNPVASMPVLDAPGNPPAVILRVEVPDGQKIRYEINPNGPLALNARVADQDSPSLTGDENFPWGSGYSLSIIEATGT